jgi:hypothetical protein
MVKYKFSGFFLSFFVTVFALYAQVQDSIMQAPDQESEQQTYQPAQANPPTQINQQKPQTGMNAEPMPIAFNDVYLQSDQSKNLFKAGADIKASILWSLVGTGLTVAGSFLRSEDGTISRENAGIYLGLTLGSLTCGIIAIVKNWQAGTKLQKASGRLRD